MLPLEKNRHFYVLYKLIVATGTAVFDSTTKFIWTDKATLDKFIEKVNLVIINFIIGLCLRG